MGTPEKIEKIRLSINENRRLTVREIDAGLRIPKTIVSKTFSQD